jgi:hypothetical protein
MTYEAMPPIVQKIHNGDSLLDSELATGLEFYTDLELKLEALGPTFRLACNEVGRIKRDLASFTNARAERRRLFHGP